MQLARAVELCTLRHSLETGEQCSAAELAAALQRRGYAARLCKSEGGGSGTAAFRNLRHTFVRVEAGSADAWWAHPAADAASEDEAGSGEVPVLVDCHFACQVRPGPGTRRQCHMYCLAGMWLCLAGQCCLLQRPRI